MLNARIANNLSNLANNRFTHFHLRENDAKIVSRFIKEVIDKASIGVYEFNFKTSEPLSDDVLHWITSRSFDIQLVGFTYKISWRNV